MNRKPTSHRDFLMTVARVRHPDLEDVHHRWLQDLALYASQTGEHAYPGYDALAEMTQRGVDRQRLYSNHCVKLGLVEITVKGRGKGVANEYRFCLDNPAYPDDYEGRARAETASVGKRDNGDEKRLSRQAVSEAKTASDDQNNPLPDVSKPLGGGSGHPILHPNLHTHTQTENVCGVLLEMAAKAGYEFRITKVQRQEIQDIASRHGSNKVIVAGKTFLHDPQRWGVRGGPNKTTDPWRCFIDNFEGIAAVEVVEKKPIDIEATNAKALEAYYEQFPVARPDAPVPEQEPSGDAFLETSLPEESK